MHGFPPIIKYKHSCFSLVDISLLTIANNDIIYIHQFCFGKWIGGLLNVFIIIYFLVVALIVLRVYIEVVQVWMFPLMKTW
jgi:hypothetical protein